MGEIIIRPATMLDLNAICQIYDAVHTAEENGELIVGWCRGVYPTRKTAEESIRRGDMFVLQDDEILGTGIINQIQVDVYETASWEYETDQVCVLHTLVISPKAAGKGYGKTFVTFYEQWAAEHGLPELRMDTNARNSAARAMYKKLGYKEIGIVPTTFNGIQGVNLVLLEKNLKESVNSAIYALHRFQVQMKDEGEKAGFLTEEDVAEWITKTRREETD